MFDRLLSLFGRKPKTRNVDSHSHETTTHVIIIDGTMSSLMPGCETNAGLTYKMLRDTADRHLSVYYEAGIQWRDWRSSLDVLMGRGINRQIKRAYGVLAGRYRPGDKIFLIGYSRGAYAVRSLAGIIDYVGLLQAENATVRNIRQIYRLYQSTPYSKAATEFKAAYCHADVQIEAIGVWDTVKALGLRLPVFWRWADQKHGFHNHVLGRHIRNGFHALALDENRVAYKPVIWQSREGWEGQLKQIWLRGLHKDIGGQ